MKKNKYKIWQPVKTEHWYYTKVIGLFYDEWLAVWTYHIIIRDRIRPEYELFELSEEEKNTYYY